jgi:hypothetical protein
MMGPDSAPGAVDGVSACPFLSPGGDSRAARPDAHFDAEAIHGGLERIIGFYALLDTKKAARAAELFDHHAVFETPTRTYEGIRAISEFLTDRDQTDRRTLHNLANLHGRSEGPDIVVVTALMMAYVPGAAGEAPWVLEQAEHARHTLRRDRGTGSWLITSRTRASGG